VHRSKSSHPASNVVLCDECLPFEMQLKVVAEAVVNFAKDLPHYNTTDGFVKEGLQVTSPTLMFSSFSLFRIRIF
jgi:hypothetical protein